MRNLNSYWDGNKLLVGDKLVAFIAFDTPTGNLIWFADHSTRPCLDTCLSDDLKENVEDFAINKGLVKQLNFTVVLPDYHGSRKFSTRVEAEQFVQNYMSNLGFEIYENGKKHNFKIYCSVR